MYKLELDNDGIIRGKCFINTSLEQLQAMKIPGPFVSDEVGSALELPAEPIYKGKNIIGGTYRPDLIAAITLELEPKLTVVEKIAAMEEDLRILKESIKGEA